MRTNALRDVFSFPRLLWRSTQRGLTGVVTGLCLILLIITLSFAPAGGVAYGQEPGPSQVGQWDGPFSTPVYGTHATVLRTGKVLLFGGPLQLGTGVVWTPPAIGEPGDGTFTSTPPPTNGYWSGHCSLADGRVIKIGGELEGAGSLFGIKDVDIFDPVSETWAVAASMQYARWYPTCTTLPDGRVWTSM